MRGGRSGGHAVLHIVDADASVRSGLCRLALAAGFEAHGHASVGELLAALSPRVDGCVILDASLAAVGKPMRDEMQRRGVDWPVIMLSTSHDEIARQRARSAGARFLLNKPVDAQALFDAIAWVTEDGA